MALRRGLRKTAGGSVLDVGQVVRVRAVKARPFFAVALFAMQMVRRPGFGTMAIDRWGRVYYDPDMIGPGKEWSVIQASGVLIHELGHWLRKHYERSRGLVELEPTELEKLAVKEALNICEDMELNDDLLEEIRRDQGVKIELPANMRDGSVLCPGSYGQEDGKLWEEYYANLKGKLKGDFKTKLLAIGINCGSAAHGVPEGYELAPPGQVEEPGIREAEGELIRLQVAKELRKHAELHRGSVAGGWERWADELLEPPQVPWERELRAMVTNAFTMARGMVDYSWAKPSRRGNFGGVIMPRLRSPVPEVAIVVDTSASMSRGDLTAACIEVSGISRSIGQRRVPVISCDSEVHSVQYVTSGVQVELQGGGGTDMSVGIAKAVELGADVVVVLTDGATPWPDEEPRGCQLVVCLIGEWGPQARELAPDWAKRVLEIDAVESE